MTRRQPLTKKERARRRAKKERRAADRNSIILQYREALKAYIFACVAALTSEDYKAQRCVCEKCGLEQPYELGQWDLQTGLVTLAVCEGWEYMGCGGELCWIPGNTDE